MERRALGGLEHANEQYQPATVACYDGPVDVRVPADICQDGSKEIRSCCRLLAHHRWWYRARDPNNTGLL